MRGIGSTPGGIRILGSLACSVALAACAQAAQPIECANNFDCEETQYCVAESCGGPGTCLARPTDCSPNVSFVCGCDAVTYDNACDASSAGIRIAAEGECECASNDDCNMGDYCDGEACGGPGTCEAKPTDCPAVFDPVCGCDGVTYDSECDAESMGVRIELPGRCPCTDNGDCLESEYCAGETCAAEGRCETRPVNCTQEFDPVCGCDDQTYSNACVAAQGGVRVALDAACP